MVGDACWALRVKLFFWPDVRKKSKYFFRSRNMHSAAEGDDAAPTTDLVPARIAAVPNEGEIRASAQRTRVKSARHLATLLRLKEYHDQLIADRPSPTRVIELCQEHLAQEDAWVGGDLYGHAAMSGEFACSQKFTDAICESDPRVGAEYLGHTIKPQTDAALYRVMGENWHAFRGVYKTFAPFDFADVRALLRRLGLLSSTMGDIVVLGKLRALINAIRTDRSVYQHACSRPVAPRRGGSIATLFDVHGGGARLPAALNGLDGIGFRISMPGMEDSSLQANLAQQSKYKNMVLAFPTALYVSILDRELRALDGQYGAQDIVHLATYRSLRPQLTNSEGATEKDMQEIARVILTIPGALNVAEWAANLSSIDWSPDAVNRRPTQDGLQLFLDLHNSGRAGGDGSHLDKWTVRNDLGNDEFYRFLSSQVSKVYIHASHANAFSWITEGHTLGSGSATVSRPLALSADKAGPANLGLPPSDKVQPAGDPAEPTFKVCFQTGITRQVMDVNPNAPLFSLYAHASCSFGMSSDEIMLKIRSATGRPEPLPRPEADVTIKQAGVSDGEIIMVVVGGA